MKKFALLLSAVFAAGPAFAQDTKPAAPEKPATETTKPDTEHKATSRHHRSARARTVSGEVVSVDAEKNTITFKNDKGESLTWPAEGKAIESLKTVKAGEKVTIAYVADEKGAPKAATRIKAAAAARIPETKAPEKK